MPITSTEECGYTLIIHVRTQSNSIGASAGWWWWTNGHNQKSCYLHFRKPLVFTGVKLGFTGLQIEAAPLSATIPDGDTPTIPTGRSHKFIHVRLGGFSA